VSAAYADGTVAKMAYDPASGLAWPWPGSAVKTVVWDGSDYLMEKD
jgi:hypothetical protein